MTLKVRVVNTEANAGKAMAGTIAKAANAVIFAVTGAATAVLVAILVASAARALVVQEAVGNSVVSAAIFAQKGAKIVRAANSEANAVKAMVAQEAVEISAAVRVVTAAFKEGAPPVKVALVQVLVSPAMGIGNPVRPMTKKTILSTGFTR
jgi:hypothetical protein